MLRHLLNYIKGNNAEADLKIVKEILSQYQSKELEVTDELLHYLCNVSKIHKNESELLVIACHMISNLALNESHAMVMIEQGIIKTLAKILKCNKYRNKLVWKCTSALWNLCRPVGIEQHIPDYLPELIFECLVINEDFARAMHTCFGALSNLALVKPAELSAIMNQETVNIMLRIVWKYRFVENITGHFGAMVANISVVEEIAGLWVENDCVRILIECLKINESKEGVKHLIAALHNISDVSLFTHNICDCKGIETLREIAKTHDHEIMDFINGIFELARMPVHATSSLQVAVCSLDLIIVVDLLKRHGDIDLKTLDGKTALELALLHKNGPIAQLLLASGAKFDQNSYEDKNERCDVEEMLPFITKGKSIRFRSQRKFTKVMLKSRPKINADVCQLMTECIPGVDLLLVLQ